MLSSFKLSQDNHMEIISHMDDITRMLARKVCKLWNEKITEQYDFLTGDDIEVLERMLNKYFHRTFEFNSIKQSEYYIKILPQLVQDNFSVLFESKFIDGDTLESSDPPLSRELAKNRLYTFLHMAKFYAGEAVQLQYRDIDEHDKTLFFDMIPNKRLNTQSYHDLRLMLLEDSTSLNLEQPKITSKKNKLKLAMNRHCQEVISQTPYLSLESRQQRNYFILCYSALPESWREDNRPNRVYRRELLEHQTVEDLERLIKSLRRYKISDIQDLALEVDQVITTLNERRADSSYSKMKS